MYLKDLSQRCGCECQGGTFSSPVKKSYMHQHGYRSANGANTHVVDA